MPLPPLLHRAPVRLLILSTVVITTVLSGCATTPRPGDPGYPYNVNGPYQGRFLFDGQPFDATMDLRVGGGGRVRGAFRVGAPVELEGPVEGAIVDDLLRITVRYTAGDGCEAELEGILTVRAGGTTIEGPITVSGCGAPTSGTMAFRRVAPSRGRP